MGQESRLSTIRGAAVRRMSRTQPPARELRDGPQNAAADPLPTHFRRRAARLGGGGQGAVVDQDQQLAQPPRIRVGEPVLAPLAAFLRRTLPFRALRRARLWHDRLGGRRPLVSAAGGGLRTARRCRRTARAVDAAGHLAGRLGCHRLRRPPPRDGVSTPDLRRLRAGLGGPRQSARRARVPRPHRADTAGLGP